MSANFLCNGPDSKYFRLLRVIWPIYKQMGVANKLGVPIKLHLQKKKRGWIWLKGYILPTAALHLIK